MGAANFAAIAAAGRPEALMDLHGVTLYNTFGAVGLFNLGSAVAAPTIQLKDAAGATTVVTLNPAASSPISTTGDINAGGVFRKGGTAEYPLRSTSERQSR
jgi:hypothetical protein